MRDDTLRVIEVARQVVTAKGQSRGTVVSASPLEYAVAIVDLVGDTLPAHDSEVLRPSQVLAALNHAAYTFRQFTAADWRDMAQECMRQAYRRTCVDCGRDVMSDASDSTAQAARRQVVMRRKE